jgi:methionine-rich copper-binding protein CopC
MKIQRHRLAWIMCVFFSLCVKVFPAQAHTVLIDSTPAVGSTISTLPDSITLKFASPLLTLPGHQVNQLTVVDPMIMQIASVPTTVGDTLSATLNESMKMTGKFSVNFKVAAQDGHIVTGSFIFTVSGNEKNSSQNLTHITSGVRRYSVDANGNNKFVMGDMVGHASGQVIINFSKNTLCYKFSVSHLTGITGAHIHAMVARNTQLNVSDEVFIALDSNLISQSKASCVKVSNQELSAIGRNPNHYFLMIHTSHYPDGAIGGVLEQVS